MASKKHSLDLEQRGFIVFAAIGRFTVKFRWLILIVWLLGTVLVVKGLPSLSSVTQSDNSSFLPSSAPSEKAMQLGSSLGENSRAEPIPLVVATTNNKKLTATDRTVIASLESRLAQTKDVKSVRSAGESADGQAYELLVIARTTGIDPTPLINNLRSTISSSVLPSDLQAHLAGQIASAVDNSKKSGSTNTELQFGSVLFIIVLLLLIFRAPLAPLITLLPPLLVVILSGPLIAEAAHHGLKVSSLAQLLLTVLVLGAGTDYGLFLIFRVREEIRAGLEPREAIVKALSRVGESITFSAATVIAALLSLLFATFQMYSNLGEPLAIGIGLMLLAGLTLLPALLAVFGRAVFWPSKKIKPASKLGFWGRVSSSVVQHPVPVLIVGVIFFGGLAIGVFGYKAGGFTSGTNPPAGSDSALGNKLLSEHYPKSSANPTAIIFRLSQSVWQNPEALKVIQKELAASSAFNDVTGPLNPNGIQLTGTDIVNLYKHFGPPQKLKALANSLGAIRSYKILTNFISADGHTVQYSVGLTAGDPSSTAAMNAIPHIRDVVRHIASSVAATDSGVLGEAPIIYDVSNISNGDLIRVIPIAILVIGVLLGFLLRSMVAPIYLIVSVALSYLAAFGLSVIIFIYIGKGSGLDFILPFLMFIFLLALGEDYNILVMTRIREEAHTITLRNAVSQALSTTGTTVTSAGMVLAGTFSVLAVVGGGSSSQIRDIGVGLALGIIMDTFLVRTLLVPSMVVLLGKWNWWPTKHGELADTSKNI